MYCIKALISLEICEVDYELKFIYRSRELVFIWVCQACEDRTRCLDKAAGMQKNSANSNLWNLFGSTLSCAVVTFTSYYKAYAHRHNR